MNKELKGVFKYLLDFAKHPEQYNDDMVALLKVEQVELLLAYVDNIIGQLQQKENIIKEVREELNKIDSAIYQGDTDKKTYYKYEQTRIQKLLEILDKEDK